MATTNRSHEQERSAVPGVICALFGTALAVTGSVLQAEGIAPKILFYILIVAAVLSFIAALVDFILVSSRIAAVLVLILVVIVIGGAYELVRAANGNNLPGVEAMSGGCASYRIYSQNRYQPYGVLIRLTPFPASKTTGAVGFAPNQQVWVDGWVHTEALNAGNRPPFDNDIWFHLSDGRGWVPYAGVREVPTSPDPLNGRGTGGTPAPAPSTCRGALQ